MNILQLKLVNGEEVMCEVVAEPEDEDVNLVVRNSMKIVQIEDNKAGFRMYSFRPWMIYQDNPDMYQLININHICGEAKPHKMLVAQFYNALKNEQENTSEQMAELQKKFEELREKLGLSIDDDDDFDGDSDRPNNVIDFRSRMH